MRSATIQFSRAVLASSFLLVLADSDASEFIECRDTSLAGMDAWAMQEAMQSAGGTGCRVLEQDYMQTLACDQAAATAFGFPVDGLRGEYTKAGLRRVEAVTRASPSQLDSASATSPVAAGLRRDIAVRKDGMAIVRCSTQTAELEGGLGTITGPLPALPDGAHAWRVCGERVKTRIEHCVDAGPGSFRLTHLLPGHYQLRATPLGSDDPEIGAVLAARSDLKAATRDDFRRRDVLLDQVTVRSGALTEVGEMEIVRLREP